MPGLTDLEVQKRLKHVQSTLSVLRLSMHSGYHCVMGGLNASASDYWNKSTAPEGLVDAIPAAPEGGL